MNLSVLAKTAKVAAIATPKIRELKVAAKGVEAMFVKSLMAEMEKGTKLFGEGEGSGIYSDMFNDAMAKQVSDRGAFGIADMMLKEGTLKIIAKALAKAK